MSLSLSRRLCRRPTASAFSRLLCSSRHQSGDVSTGPRQKGLVADNRLRLLYQQFSEPYNMHRQILTLQGRTPKISVESYLSPDVLVAGNVEVSDRVSVWFGAVVRQNPFDMSTTSSADGIVRDAEGNEAKIHLGYGSNIQDNAVVSGAAVHVGNFVTVGHGAVLHSCIIEDESLVGIRSVVMPGAVVEKNAFVAGGAVIPPGVRVKSGELWAGNPGRKIRNLKYNEIEYFMKSAEEYWKLAMEHQEGKLPDSHLFREVERIRQAIGIIEQA